MILPDHEIRSLCSTIEIRDSCDAWPQNPMIRPYSEDQLEPASYDVRLGNDFKIFQRDEGTAIDLRDPDDITRHVHVNDQSFFTLHRHEFALGVTREHFVIPDNVVARIEGKSSIGRLGLAIHITAGFIDPGFNGPITLEMHGVHPLSLLLYPGMKIAQVSFHAMSSPPEKPYSGRYQNAKGVESSKYGQ
jgi:dCTP deaminase